MADLFKSILLPGSPQVAAQAAASGKASRDKTSNGDLEKACQNFESLFVHQMLKQMRDTVPKDGMFAGGSAEQVYTSMLDSELAKDISQKRGIGLASILYRQLSSFESTEKKEDQNNAKVTSQATDNPVKQCC